MSNHGNIFFISFSNASNIYRLTIFILLFGLATMFYLFINLHSMAKQRVGRSFITLIFVYMIWLVGYIVEFLATTEQYKQLWFDFQYIGIVLIPFAWMAMVFLFYDRKSFVKYIKILGFAFFALTFVIYLWNDRTGLLYSNFQILSNEYLSYVSIEYGTWSYLIMIITFFSLLTTIIINFQGINKQVSENQTLIYVFPIYITLFFLTSISYFMGYFIIPNVNTVLLLSFVYGTILIIATRNTNSFGIIPSAYRIVIENLNDGVIIVDNKNNIITSNKIAQKIFTDFNLDDIFKKINEHLIEPIEFISDLEELSVFGKHIRFKDQSNNKYYEFFVTKAGEEKDFHGYILQFKDISYHFQAYQHIQHVARTDSLTNTINRGFFEEAYVNLKSKLIPQSTISFVLIDLDNFKSINDEYGHIAGDQILKIFAQSLRNNFRNTDLIIRYGGDEFIIILPNVTTQIITYIISGIQAEFESTVNNTNNHIKAPSFSYGICQYIIKNNNSDPMLEDIINCADKEMYKQKQQKNQTKSNRLIP